MLGFDIIYKKRFKFGLLLFFNTKNHKKLINRLLPTQIIKIYGCLCHQGISPNLTIYVLHLT